MKVTDKTEEPKKQTKWYQANTHNNVEELLIHLRVRLRNSLQAASCRVTTEILELRAVAESQMGWKQELNRNQRTQKWWSAELQTSLFNESGKVGTSWAQTTCKAHASRSRRSCRVTNGDSGERFLAIPSDPKERKGNAVTFGQHQSLVGLLPTSKHLEP